MPMKPSKGESQGDFMKRCMSETFGSDAPEDRTQEQAVAICMNYWRAEHGGAKPEKAYGDAPLPEEDEEYEDYIDRCVVQVMADEDCDEATAEETCELAWEERALPKGQVKHKAHSGIVQGMEFVLSDETPDRLGDVVSSAGWDIKNFLRNPVALFNHNANFPVGKWESLRVENKALRGHLQLAPAGTSARIDEIRKLVECGILKAVSVGFKPIESKPLTNQKNAGEHFLRQELVETSLVSVPANPNALAVAKSLQISAETIDLVFAEHGNQRRAIKRRGVNGGHAEVSSRNRRKGGAMSLAQRIKDAEARKVALRDKLNEHMNSVDDSNVTDTQLELTNELTARLTQEEKSLTAMREAEKHLAISSDEDREEQTGTQLVLATSRQPARSNGGGTSFRPFSLPAKKIDPVELVIRAGTVAMFAHTNKRPIEETRLALAQEYPHYNDEATKGYIDYVMRAATNPAMTSVTGWAAELVQTIYSNFMETLMPKSVFPRLSGYGLSLSFGRAGQISIPTRSRTPTIAGSFVGEGQPIPVRQGAFTAQILTPKKMAVITTWTREIDSHSVPAIEGLLRQAISEDTAVSLDAILLDANAATSIRPPGILNGVTVTTATAGGGFNALVGDIKNLTGALITGTSGHLRSPVWLMNPQQLNSAGLIPAPNSGVFPFRDELQNQRLQGYPIIDSGTVPLGTVILIDAADFVVAGGESPRFEVSDQATLHMEDTTPLPIVGTSPATVASPVRSLWQTDSLALRLILPINWALRRTGVVAWTQAVTW
jgi:HK97 family phage prohead protease/HK97 family phage major capsid protein